MNSYQALLLSAFSLCAAAPAFAQVASNASPATSGAVGAAPMVLVDGKPVGAAEPWAAKPVGKYDVTIVTPGEMLSAHITVGDSLGKLASVMTIDGQGTMGFEPTINGNELTLVMKRERAPITIRLMHRGERVSGTWTVGEDVGTLEGVAVPLELGVGTRPASLGAPSEAWNAKPVGAYRVTLDIPGHAMTADITVKEVNGKLMANMWPVGDHDGHDMDVAVLANQLVLTTDSPRGHVTLTLEHRGPKISGTWQLGSQSGALSGGMAK
jgi:hypothetical protein